MKNIKSLALLSLVLSGNVIADEIDLKNQSLYNDIGLEGLKSYDELLLKNSYEMTWWYWYRTKGNEFKKLLKDDFAFKDSFDANKKELIEKLTKKESNFIGKNSYVNMKSSFGSYDFTNSYFPIKIIDQDSKISYNGYGFKNPGGIINNLNLYFINLEKINNHLNMEKEKAKEFLNSRKNTVENINKELEIKYHYTISDIKVDENIAMDILNCNFNGRSVSRCSPINVNLYGKINKIDIIDSADKNNTILESIEIKD